MLVSMLARGKKRFDMLHNLHNSPGKSKVEILRHVSHVFAGGYFDLDMHNACHILTSYDNVKILEWCQRCQFPEPPLECPSS